MYNDRFSTIQVKQKKNYEDVQKKIQNQTKG